MKMSIHSIEGTDILNLQRKELPSFSEQVIVYVWQHTLPSDELLAFIHTHAPDFIPRVSGIRGSRRMVEKLSVQFLLYQLLGAEAQICYHATGRPYLAGMSCEISISHTANSYALSLSPFRHGIDMEQWGPQAARVSTKFLNAGDVTAEQHYPQEFNSQMIATLLWSAKEAVYKYVDQSGLSLQCDISLAPQSPGCLQATLSISPQKASVSYVLLPQCVLTVCTK